MIKVESRENGEEESIANNTFIIQTNKKKTIN